MSTHNPKFKIGDRVRVKATGDRGTVTMVTQDVGCTPHYRIKRDGTGAGIQYLDVPEVGLEHLMFQAKQAAMPTVVYPSSAKPPSQRALGAAETPMSPPEYQDRFVPPSCRSLPTDSAERKTFPLFSGLIAYFPAALAEVANHSFINNEKHNPGQPLQHARGKSGDHLDCVFRHIVDSREVTGRERIEELRGACWRNLAELQEECERQGRVTAPAATFPSTS